MRRLSLRDSTPCRPKGSPLGTFSEIHFWPTDPKNFLQAPLAPIYTNFEGERAQKNAVFLSAFSKSAQERFFLPVFSKNFLRCRKFDQNSVFLAL